jgi:hypothetical protein
MSLFVVAFSNLLKDRFLLSGLDEKLLTNVSSVLKYLLSSYSVAGPILLTSAMFFTSSFNDVILGDAGLEDIYMFWKVALLLSLCVRLLFLTSFYLIVARAFSAFSTALDSFFYLKLFSMCLSLALVLVHTTPPKLCWQLFI